MFKEKMWREKHLEVEIMLRYYKYVTTPNLKVWKYLSILARSKKKINIPKITMNSHELHREIWRWSVPKSPWLEMICHLCESIIVKNENHFLLECLTYIDIRFGE